MPVPPGATVVEPRAPVPKENPVDMAALGAKLSARMERPGMLLSPHCRGGTCSIAVAKRGPGGKFNPQGAGRRGRTGRSHTRRMRDTACMLNAPETCPPRKGPWDRGGGGPSVRQLGWVRMGAPPTLLKR